MIDPLSEIIDYILAELACSFRKIMALQIGQADGPSAFRIAYMKQLRKRNGVFPFMR